MSKHAAEIDAPADDPGWEACWNVIATAAWPFDGANRAEVLELLLSVRYVNRVTPPEVTHCANCGGEVPVDKPHRVGECVNPPEVTRP